MASVTVTLDQALKAGQRNYGQAFAESWHDALDGDWRHRIEGVTYSEIADFFGFWFVGCERISVDYPDDDEPDNDLPPAFTVTFGFDTDDEAVHYLLRWL